MIMATLGGMIGPMIDVAEVNAALYVTGYPARVIS